MWSFAWPGTERVVSHERARPRPLQHFDSRLIDLTGKTAIAIGGAMGIGNGIAGPTTVAGQGTIYRPCRLRCEEMAIKGRPPRGSIIEWG